jgi:hypothetical protein
MARDLLEALPVVVSVLGPEAIREALNQIPRLMR